MKYQIKFNNCAEILRWEVSLKRAWPSRSSAMRREKHLLCFHKIYKSNALTIDLVCEKISFGHCLYIIRTRTRNARTRDNICKRFVRCLYSPDKSLLVANGRAVVSFTLKNILNKKNDIRNSQIQMAINKSGMFVPLCDKPNQKYTFILENHYF